MTRGNGSSHRGGAGSRTGAPRARATRRALLGGLLAPLLATAGCGEGRPPMPAEPVNVLLISIDSLRADHLGAYGYARDTSPNIDRLAREGVLFEQMVAETSWTLPSHITMLTGLPSAVHRLATDGTRLPDGVRTLAEALASAGYRTEAFVTAPYVHPIFGFDQGFESYRVLGRTIYDSGEITPERMAAEPGLGQEFARMEAASHRTRTSDDLSILVSDAVGRLAGQPFFLFVHMFDVHYDYDPPEEYWRRFNPDYQGDVLPKGYYRNPLVNPRMAAADLEQVIALYDGEILWTDSHIGQMLDALDRSGVADHTLVAVIGDHGEEFFEHGAKGHRKTLYDEQLLVPFVMRLPARLPAGRRLGMQVRMIDVMPTILDLAGLDPATPVGESLAPYVWGEKSERHLPAHSTLVTRSELVHSLRLGDRKLVVTRPLEGWTEEMTPRLELFDLAADPAEKVPLGDREALLEMRRELSRTIAEEETLRRRVTTSANPAIELPEEMREALEELGYTE